MGVHRSERILLVVVGLLLLPGTVARAQHVDTVRIHLISDVHSQAALLDRFRAAVARDRPDLVLDAGDMVHDGTASEFERAFAQRAGLRAPWHVARGNHDARLRGPFDSAPPSFAVFGSVSVAGLRLLLLDNHDERITDEQFSLLEAELAANAGERVVVLMHVPPFLSREPALLRLRRLIPFDLASPVMRDAGEVERFMELMERYRVLAVLTGHTHFGDHQVRGGVHYIVAGAGGGLTPGWRLPNEFVAIELNGRTVSLRREELRGAPGDPLRLVARVFRFYAELNAFNHASQGWNYVPSASVQLRTGLERIDGAGPDRIVWHGALSFERLLGETGRRSLISDLGVVLGPRDALLGVSAAHRLRVLGSFQRNMFISAGAIASAGGLNGRASAGAGVQLGGGIEWRGVTAELSRSRATHHRTATLRIGHRY